MTFFEKVFEFEQIGEEFVIVTLLKTRGHAPQDPGAKGLIHAKGLAAGTVGGGKVEAKAIEFSKQLLSASVEKITTVTWNLQRDVGMSCGGEVDFIFEVFKPQKWKIVVFGAGHVAQSLIPLLLQLDCHVTCVDNRAEWIEKLPQKSAKLKILFCQEYSEAISQISPDSFCVVMTRGHATDLPVLENLFKKGHYPYVGVIGSRVKAQKIRQDLKNLGIDQEKIEKLKSPMGIPIGNSNHPAEIAISISAELIFQRTAIQAPKMATKPPITLFHEKS